MKNFTRKASLTIVGAVTMVILGASNAFAAVGDDPVADAFTTGQTKISTYIASGIGVIVAVLLLGLGVGLLVKYLRKAVRAA